MNAPTYNRLSRNESALARNLQKEYELKLTTLMSYGRPLSRLNKLPGTISSKNSTIRVLIGGVEVGHIWPLK